MLLIDKKIVNGYNGKMFFLGKGKDGLFYYLEEPSWDCGWYWGFGYMEGFSQNKIDSGHHQAHTHVDSTFFDSRCSMYDKFKEFFETTTLMEDEIWKLLEYHSTLYTLKEMSGITYCGGSHITSKVEVSLKDDKLYARINQEMMPAVFEDLYKLLTPKDEKFEIRNCII